MKLITLLGFVTVLASLPAHAAENPFTPPNFPAPTFHDKTYNVKDYGAQGDGVANDTPAIDKAIAACNGDGGGTVHFPAGQYSAASIHIKSNVRLLLDKDATIFGGAKENFDPPEPNQFDKYQDFGHSHFHNSLMWGERIENFAIEGGKLKAGSIIRGDSPQGGDKLVSIVMGKDLLFRDITHDKGGHFCYLLNDCENVTFDRIVIKESRDGVDLMGCRNVQIHDCRFTGCGDDTIGVKSDWALGRKILTENIYVWDCYFESYCNGLQFGSETAGDFRNCNFWNIGIGLAGKAGIGMSMNDGGVIDGVNYSNIVIKAAITPIFMVVTDRLRSGDTNKNIGTIRNVHIMNVTASDARQSREGTNVSCTLSGLPERSLENITIENVKITYRGGQPAADASIVPPTYPQGMSVRNVGPRPAAGFYIRRANNVTLKNVQVNFEKPDGRPSIIASDVDGLTLDGFEAQKPTGVVTLRQNNVNNLTVCNSPGLPDQKAETNAKLMLLPKSANASGTAEPNRRVAILKQYNLTGNIVKFGDVNGDGLPDILSINMSDWSVYVYDHGGKELWHYQGPDGSDDRKNNEPPGAIWDLDQDGYGEVLHWRLIDDMEYLVVADGRTGAVLKKVPWPTRSRPHAYSSFRISIAQLHRDDYPNDIILYTDTRGDSINVAAYDSNLGQLWRHDEKRGKDALGHYPYPRDLDGDGLDEVVLSHLVLDSDGSVIWDNFKRFPSNQDHCDSFRFADVTGDGKVEILAGVSGRGVYAFDALTGAVLWHHDSNHAQQIEFASVLDLPGATAPQIAISDRYYKPDGIYGQVHWFSAIGTLLKKWPDRPIPCNPDFVKGDWEGDGHEVLFWYKYRMLLDGTGVSYFENEAIFMFDFNRDGADEVIGASRLPGGGSNLRIYGSPTAKRSSTPVRYTPDETRRKITNLTHY